MGISLARPEHTYDRREPLHIRLCRWDADRHEVSLYRWKERAGTRSVATRAGPSASGYARCLEGVEQEVGNAGHWHQVKVQRSATRLLRHRKKPLAEGRLVAPISLAFLFLFPTFHNLHVSLQQKKVKRGRFINKCVFEFCRKNNRDPLGCQRRRLVAQWLAHQGTH